MRPLGDALRLRLRDLDLVGEVSVLASGCIESENEAPSGSCPLPLRYLPELLFGRMGRFCTCSAAFSDVFVTVKALTILAPVSVLALLDLGRLLHPFVPTRGRPVETLTTVCVSSASIQPHAITPIAVLGLEAAPLVLGRDPPIVRFF